MSETSQAGPPANPLAQFIPQRSAGLKLLLVCGLALLMAIPALFVFGVVQDRRMGADRALTEVSQAIGGSQSLLGPVLVLPFSRAPNPARPNDVVYGNAIAFAETGTADADVQVTERKRGIHTIPVFDAHVTFDATFDPGALRAALPEGAEPVWADARLYMGVSDTRGIREAFRVTANGKPVAMEPAPYRYGMDQAYQPVPSSGVSLAGGVIGDLQTAETPIRVTAALRLTGAERFAVGPFAKDTSFSLKSNWDDPSFQGGKLPDSHTASVKGVEGFTASWRVPYLARDIAGAGSNIELSDVTEYNRRDMAVRFMKEVSPYQSVERALKYAAMFIGFVFLAWFLFEVTSGARAHPAQYVLVGLAQSIFYILLLAFAERMGFDGAFLIAAVMTVGLISAYAMSVFRSRAYGLRALGILSGIYGLIYVLMRAESHALLAGALASFAAIALTMYMTRNVDWYGGRKAGAAA
ncbi:MAG: cell envelope integrity protein CreD [Hyphomonas sp.]|uniref:cell envelope integrity protein CreD n=1 Tax=Hyphomonas sp. TaxID=87 RepID=UPI003528D178